MDTPSALTPDDTAPTRRARTRRWSPKDDLLIESLLLGQSYAQAGERANVSLSTVKRRMADPGFQRRLQELQEESIKQVRRRVTASATAATQVLVRIAADTGGAASKAGASRQVAAARAILHAFVALQPRGAGTDMDDLLGAPVIDYVLVGIDPEVLR